MKNLLRIALFIVIFPLLALKGGEDPDGRKEVSKVPDFRTVEGTWAKEQLGKMSLEEKIGQLFMLSAYSNKDEAHFARTERFVTENHIGGLIFMQGGPGRQVNLVNRYQRAAKVPLLIAQDSEWGLSMRLDSTVRYPKNMTLGAITQDSLIYNFGFEIGRQCRDVGVQVNFAPVVDVNNNPMNPVINNRSFGENRENVARKGIDVMRGMYHAGVLACAKHFPGHGDTDTDSHLDLPVIMHPRERLDSIELYPFKRLIEAGVPSVMVAHLYIPALDSTANTASTLSPKIVGQLLKEDLAFRGLVFTDALGMKGITKFYPAGTADLKAFMAGNDILLFSGDVEQAAQLIKAAVESGEISEAELNLRVYKILLAKEWAGLHDNRFTNDKGLASRLRNRKAEILKKELYESAITLVKNGRNILPLRHLDFRTLAHVQIGGQLPSPFYEAAKKYAAVDHYYVAGVSDGKSRAAILKKLEAYNTVIVTIEGMNKYAKRDFGVSTGTREFIQSLNGTQKSVILGVFGNPYALKFFGQEQALVAAYESTAEAQTGLAEVIFGGLVPTAKLPVTASDAIRSGAGKTFRFPERFAFAYPEEAGMDAAVLESIDSIAEAAIAMGATPGCAILAMRGNKIVYDKSFGAAEYGSKQPVDPYLTLWDMASVTKIAATTLATMRLVDEGKLDIDESVAAYLPEFRNTDKSHITLKKLLTHNAGLKSWIPFWVDTYAQGKSGPLDTAVYHGDEDLRFCVPIVEDLYMCVDYQDSIWLKIVDSNVRTGDKVVYSDLGMIIMGRVIERVTKTTLDNYVDSVFYRPMGMNHTLFNPAAKGFKSRCAPTEVDDYWRNVTVQGYVHDQASAMLGGVAGHAGLFSNTYDLAKLMYMLTNKGRYGGVRYLDKDIITQFTTKQLEESRKGLGFDKAEMDSTKSSACSRYSSAKTFGHTGFTGIGVWADPEYDLVYIFLSNRTMPKSNNNLLLTENVRTNIMDKLYESIFAYESQKLQ